jgi:hypothetical protein
VSVVLTELTVADDPGTWIRLGFAVRRGAVRAGGVTIRLAGQGAGEGIVGWRLRGAASTELDGLPTEHDDGADPGGPEAAHPNGVAAVDHVVAFTDRFDRTTTALQAAGLELRRVRDVPGDAGVRQGFYVLGPALLELAGPVPQPDGRAVFWGITFVTEDLDGLAERLGPERVAAPRDAVQPGRRIASLRRAAGSSVPLAFMTPRPLKGSAADADATS